MPVIAHIDLSPAEREKFLQQIGRAKTAHLRWRAYAQALLSGHDIEEGHLPLEHDECQFGRWYYGAGQALRTLPEFRAIDAPHQQLHQVCMDLFNLLKRSETPSLWQRIIDLAGKGDRKKTAEIQSKAALLTRVSGELLRALETLERQLQDTKNL